MGRKKRGGRKKGRRVVDTVLVRRGREKRGGREGVRVTQKGKEGKGGGEKEEKRNVLLTKGRMERGERCKKRGRKEKKGMCGASKGGECGRD